MNSAELLADAFGRVREAVHQVLQDVDSSVLTARLDDEANTVAWLVWHLTRVQDDHISAVAGTQQQWTKTGWARRFELPLADTDIGYGHSADEVASVTGSAEDLRGYFDAVHQATLEFVATITDADLDRIVDERWDPPVTLGVRLVSVLEDCLQHVGQAAFVRGVLERRR